MASLIDITGKALSGEWGNDDTEGTGIPVLRTTNFTNDGIINFDSVVTRSIPKKDLTQKYLRTGDIIIEKSGGSDKQPVGRVVYYDGPESTYLFNNFTGVLRVQDTSRWLPRYVFYALFANYLQGGTRRYENRTTGLHNLQTDQYVADMQIIEASLAQQQECIRLLDSVAHLISLRKQQIALLDELVKARFVELFGDQKSNPFGWEQCSIGECCTLKSGTSLPAEVENEGGPIPYIKVGDMNYHGNERYITTSSRYVSAETAGKGLFEVGSVLFPKRGGAIGTNKKRLTRLPVCADLNVIGVSSNGKLLPEYLFTYFDLIDLGTLADGSSIPQINNRNIAPLVICLPTMELQRQFAAFVAQTDQQKSTIQQSLAQLELLKKALMQKYFG